MAVLKVIELIASSELGWEDATRKAVEKASKTVKNICSVYVQDQKVILKDSKISEFSVNLKITFMLE